MNAKTRLRAHYSQKCLPLRSVVAILVLSSTILLTLSAATLSPSSKGPTAFHQQTLPLARVYPYLAYDEQSGVTFTQDFASLAFNVSAIAQTGPDGVGPSYLLDGLTDAGYWYQVGLSWKWPSTNGPSLPGFNMNYEVFDQFGFSVYPTNGGGGIDTLRVSAGDLVLLNLNFTGGNVVMQAMDWNTGSIATETYSAEGASYFVGLPNTFSSNGFFSGLMTEEYHSAPYNGTGQPVLYQQNGFNISSAWVWADEFNTNTFQPVFSDATTSPLIFSNATLLNYFTSYGTALAVSGRQFITGLSPIKVPLVKASTSATLHAGEQATITLSIQNPGGLALRVKSLTISTRFGVFDVSSSVPTAPITGNSTFTTSITIPVTVTSGNYTLTTVADWQFLDPQIKDWIAPDPLKANTTIPIGGTRTPSTGTPNQNPLLTFLHRALLPAALAYAVAVALAVALVVRRQRQRTVPGPIMTPLTCKVCGNLVGQTMLFCPNCGSSLTVAGDATTLPASPGPPSSR